MVRTEVVQRGTHHVRVAGSTLADKSENWLERADVFVLRSLGYEVINAIGGSHACAHF